MGVLAALADAPALCGEDSVGGVLAAVEDGARRGAAELSSGVAKSTLEPRKPFPAQRGRGIADGKKNAGTHHS